MDVLLNDNPKKAFQITEQKIDGGSLVAVGFLGHLLANYQMLLECRKSAVDVYKEYFDYRINAFDAEQQSKPMQKRLTRADFVRQHLKNEGLAFDYSKSQKLFSFFTLEDTFLLLDYLWDYMLYFKDNSGCIFSIEKIDYALGGTNLNIINAEKYIEHDLLFENGQVGRMVVGCDSYELDDDVKEFPEDYYWLTFYNSDYDSVVLASGFMVYYLYNQNEETPSIFNGYYEWAKKQYYNTLAKKPRVATLVESEIEKEFAKQHIIDEEIRIKASYALFDYFPLYGCKKIYEFSKAYIKYAESIKKHLWNEADDEVDIIMNDGALDNGVKTPSADTSKEMYPDEENSNPQPNEKTSSTDEPKEDNQEEKEYHKGAIEDFANLEDGYWSHPYLWANGKVGVIINTYKYDNYDGDFEDEHSFFRFVPEEQISEFKAAWIDYNNPDLVWTGSRHEYFAEVLQHLSPVTFELEGMWLEEYIDRTGKRTTDIFEQFFKKEMDKYLKEKSIEPDAATKDYKKEFVFDFHAKYFMYNIDTRLQKYLYEDDEKDRCFTTTILRVCQEKGKRDVSG